MNPMQRPSLTTLLRWLVSLALAASLAACGGGSGGSKPVETEDAHTTTVTLGAMGGRITATASTGVRYTLAVPAGALESDTRIGLTPISSMGDAPLARGLRAAVRFSPSGLVFKVPATLEIESATAGATAPARQRTVAFSRSEDGKTMRLAVPTLSNGLLTLPVFHFSDAGAADATEDEILEVPKPPTVSQILAERLNEAQSAGVDLSTDAKVADLLRRLYTTEMLPALRVSGSSPDASGALDAYEVWLHFIDLNGGAVRSLLAPELADAQPRVAAMLRGQFDDVLATCATASGANELTVIRLLLQRQRALTMGVATAAEGLAPADTLRRVNDCVRPLLDPINLPTPMQAGAGFSLDAKASLVTAVQTQTPLNAGLAFDFTVTSNDASLARGGRGFSDRDGRFTVVATPRVAQAQFQVTACLVFPDARNPPTVTDLCVSSTVPDLCARVSSGVFINSAAAVAAAQDLVEVTGTVNIDASTSANLGALVLPCLRKVVGNVSTLGTGGLSVLKMPRLTEIGGSFVVQATGFTQIEAPLLASVRSISLDSLHGGLTSVVLGPARVTDAFQITRIDRANPPDLKTLFPGLDGMSVDSFQIDSSTSGVLCRSAVEHLLGRVVVRNPNGLPTLAFLRSC